MSGIQKRILLPILDKVEVYFMSNIIIIHLHLRSF
jgi:hypothetical protein